MEFRFFQNLRISHEIMYIYGLKKFLEFFTCSPLCNILYHMYSNYFVNISYFEIIRSKVTNWCFKASAVLMFYPHYINLLQDSWKHAAIPWRFLHIFLLRQCMQILLSFQGLHRKAPKTWICTSLKLIVKACQTWIRICFWRVSVISLLNIIRK